MSGKKSDKTELFDEQGNSRGFYSHKNILNDLTGKEWVFWTKSVINKPYPLNMQHKLRSKHGGQKPPELCADLIKIFTKQGDTVFDPYSGVGGTLLGAALCDRKAVGIEINQEWIDIYKEVCSLENLPVQNIIHGDSRDSIDDLITQGTEVDFLLTDVPYWSMDKVKRSRGKFKKVGQEQKDKKQSKLNEFNRISYDSKEQWLDSMRGIFQKSKEILKTGKYMAVFIGDMYNTGEYHYLSADLSKLLSDIGLVMKANLIWYDVSKSLHVYGYQYQFIPSMIHQNILIFRKED